jgi:hypothetical protein
MCHPIIEVAAIGSPAISTHHSREIASAPSDPALPGGRIRIEAKRCGNE